ncbi:hypothetical protein ROZALSC1DRAFT_30708, partial [Rozella allomycis CSF55]
MDDFIKPVPGYTTEYMRSFSWKFPRKKDEIRKNAELNNREQIIRRKLKNEECQTLIIEEVKTKPMFFDECIGTKDYDEEREEKYLNDRLLLSSKHNKETQSNETEKDKTDEMKERKERIREKLIEAQRKLQRTSIFLSPMEKIYAERMIDKYLPNFTTEYMTEYSGLPINAIKHKEKKYLNKKCTRSLPKNENSQDKDDQLAGAYENVPKTVFRKNSIEYPNIFRKPKNKDYFHKEKRHYPNLQSLD